ncbi:MAG TPA: FHA domain-containing protein [Steroidobacteraceae bacterium]|nr:FHA domain-containing protein [Steroidobacteraceae bacterium]
MAAKTIQSPEVDLDRTDQLPILEGVRFDPDVEDDAVRMEHAAAAELPSSATTGEFIRPSPVDLPSLAESVRSIELRIERQNAEYEALSRSYERAREAESAANARASTLEKDLAAARGALESEQARSRDIEKTLAERAASVDATTVQVVHSLAERDAQLAALQQQHAKILPTLEARERTAAKLEDDLTSARTGASAIALELKSSQALTAALGAELKRSESAVSAARSDSTVAKTQASAYLELLRSREWRRGFDLNLFREMDARVGAADTGRDALQIDCDRLRGQLADQEAKIAAQNTAIEALQAAAAAHATAFAQQAKDLKLAEQARGEWASTLKVADAEREQLSAALAARDRALAEALAAGAAETQRAALLESDAATQEEEMTVLMAHLQEARRPIQAIEGDMKRLQEELAAKTTAAKELTEETEKLRAALERTRGALAEREFLIRRLERSESNNATALGRIQTTMERLGSVAAPALERSAELIRIDGEKSTSHVLGRRTRIGRATGCELHIDSSSVSRHHALILLGGRETIIEDLNSTNGVLVNGRHVTRQVLSDGDLLIIGEIHFRYEEKPARRPGELPPAGSAEEHVDLAVTRPPYTEVPFIELPGAEPPQKG